jgi:hypothetical protein
MGKILTLLAVLFSNLAFAQSKLKVHVIDSVSKEPMPFASVGIFKYGHLINSGNTDTTGWVVINPIDTGRYNIYCIYPGYYEDSIKFFLIKPNQMQVLEMKILDGPMIHDLK